MNNTPKTTITALTIQRNDVVVRLLSARAHRDELTPHRIMVLERELDQVNARIRRLR